MAKLKKTYIYVSLMISIAILIFGFVYINSFQKYKAEIFTLKDEINNLNNSVNSPSQNQRVHLKKYVEYYKNLSQIYLLKEKLNKIQNRKKYIFLIKNYNSENLGINNLENNLTNILNEIKKLEIFIQRNETIDKDILSSREGHLTYGSVLEKYKELLSNNKDLKNDASKITIDEKIKDAYMNFIESLNYKEKYILLLIDGTNAEVAYLSLKDYAEDTRKTGLRYINSSDYYSSYVAETYLDTYKTSSSKAEEKKEQAQDHYKSANEMALKYKDLYEGN